jgi:peptidyl-prolyl cis-trans isomerase D
MPRWRRRFAQDPFFQSAGSFDRFRFDSFLRQTGMSEAQFAESVRRDIGRNRILAPLRNLAEAPAPLVERLGRYRGETRSGTLLVVPRAEMAVGEPDDAALQALLEEEAARFTAPEYRSVSLVTLTTEALVDEIEIEESRLRAEYEARRDFYTRAERRRAGQLLASDREVIEAAAAALAEGAVFAELATSMAADGLTYSTLGTHDCGRPAGRVRRGDLRARRGRGERAGREPVRLASFPGDRDRARRCFELRRGAGRYPP